MTTVNTMHYSRKVLGERIFNKVAKATFYGQFVGGDNESSLMSCVDRIREAGIRLMLAIPMEDDAEQTL
ncbi:hypothetical protein KUTeg_009767 [Tegillarca granosa]|uniref:Proline dehydrogenase n=1 Tax=Tegillarca granosa TaxID=220873 RepID=A0ABQ9F4T5_TEGGR|nr:hypothetical protein KUTeg_009767 [Tegillarca granosa]